MAIQKDGREALNFSSALAYMRKSGRKLSRVGWNGDNMFVYWVEGSTFEVNRPPLLGIYPEGKVINYLPHIDMVLPSGDVCVWQPGMDDLVAEDWFIVQDDEIEDAQIEEVTS